MQVNWTRVGQGGGEPTAQNVRKQVGPAQTYQVGVHFLLSQPYKPTVVDW